ncbi:MAG: serine/threonine protein kinase [Deltaproteobacteria bacterium]|nr:serine/threonine protein kinase [Deltaproteobacteria bacterium]
MSTPESGEKLGKYRLLELVGQGGMASVYRAVDEDLDREVAIKILHPHLQTKRDARKRFRREAKSVARLAHRNILTIYDYSGEDARVSFIVTPFIAGPQLKQLADRCGPFPHEIVAAMAKQVSDGLIVAHDNGIIHRDVKPENILVDEDGMLKIADFGIALIVDTQEMTATGQILGSPYYMSPEHVLGKGLDARADVFSFGSLLFWMVTGRQAFEGPNPHAVLKRIVEGDVEPLERFAPAAGQAMARIALTCHVKDRDERPANLVPVAEMLERYLAMSGVEDPVQEVKHFLDAPDTYRSATKPRTLKALMREGDARRKEGQSSAAMDAYNRVLALEPDHSGALRRVQDVASARAWRRLATRLGVLALASALLVVMIFWGSDILAALGWSSDPDILHARVDASAGLDASTQPVAKKDAAVDAPAVVDAPRVDAAVDAPPADGTGPGPKPVKKPAGKRLVKFVSFPMTVIIWVDGKKVGDYFNHRTMELGVGKHTVRFEPQTDCCEPAEWTVTVHASKPGADPQSIGKRLAFKPASLHVVTDKPARVSVDGNYVGQSGGKPFSVPMKGSSERSVIVSVSADGYKTITKKLKLNAGKTASLPYIKMQPDAG